MTDDDKTPATPEEAKAALVAAYELGRQAGAAEEQPPEDASIQAWYPGRQLQRGGDAYETELKAKAAELRESGEFRPNHPAFAEIKSRHGR